MPSAGGGVRYGENRGAAPSMTFRCPKIKAASRTGSPTPIADESAATLLTPMTKVRGVADWEAPSRVGDRDGINVVLAPLALQHKMRVIDIDLRGTTGCWPR